MIYRYGFAQFRAKAALQRPRGLLRPVLGEAAISVLGTPELLLEHPEGMFDPRPYHCDDPVDGGVDGVQRVAPRRQPGGNRPLRLLERLGPAHAVLVIVGSLGDGLKSATSP